MEQSFIRAGIVAATLIFGAPIVLAQSQPEPPQPKPGQEELAPVLPAPLPEAPAVPEAEAPGDQQAGDDAPPRFDDQAARKAHLDGLFERLADPDAEDWERVQAQIWQTWAQSGSASMDLLAQRADIAIQEKRLDTAMVHLNDLVRLAPDHAEGWNKRATLHFMQGNFGPSLDDIAETLRREPRHFGALSGLGIILDRIGDEEGALEAYRRAVAIHPNLPGAQEGIKKLTKEVEGERL